MTTSDAQQAIETLAKIGRRIRNGDAPDEVLEAFSLRHETVEEWIDRYSAPPDIGQIMNQSGLLDGIAPLFTEEENGSLQQTATGVLVRIGESLICLTASHCYRPGATKPLHLPSQEGIVPMNGRYFFDPHPSAATSQDTVDAGYCRLDSDIAEIVTKRFVPIPIERFLFTDHWEEGDLYTFCGYPWRKTETNGNTHSSEFTSYTGHALPIEFHSKTDLDPHVNIAIRLRRKKTFSSRYESFQTAPLPHGISGGPILAWPPYMAERTDPSNLMLGGIGHTHWDRKNCLVGTRLIPIALAIMFAEPDLRCNFPSELQRILK